MLEKLLPIFDYVPGDRSPPPAPKHATAATNRPRQPRQTAAARRGAANGRANNKVANPTLTNTAPVASQASEDQYDVASMGQYQEEGTPDNMTVISENLMDEDPYSQYPGNRKRKRGSDQLSVHDQQHQIWADQLLDYFMLLESEDRFPSPPEPPIGVNLDRAIDEKGHSALHWAAAMGDIDVVKDLIKRRARIDCTSDTAETPFMRAVMFTNNYDKQTMESLVRLLAPTIHKEDFHRATVFHHIAATTSSKNKYTSARYYMDTIINILSETWTPEQVTSLLNSRDNNGDTAVMIAARHGARKFVRTLLDRHVTVDRQNHAGETADDLIRDLNARRRFHSSKSGGGGREISSSPFPADHRALNGDAAAVERLINPNTTVSNAYRSQTANSILTRIVPTLSERLHNLAQAIETEYAAKAEEELEIERVLRKRSAEIDFLRKQLMDVAPVEDALNSLDPSEEAREEAELRNLESEAESLLELESLSELRNVVQKNTLMAAPSLPADPRSLAAKLQHAQGDRRKLVKTVVGALGNAGLGERQEGYKRLIRGALGVHENDVEGMLEEIIRELEEEARERGALVGHD